MNRNALAAASLMFSAACIAQTAIPGTTGAEYRGEPYRPAALQPQGAPLNPQAAADQPKPEPQPVQVFGTGKEYRVGANDLLDFEILNLENGKRTVRVNTTGFVSLPLIGAVAVAGLTQQEIEAQVAALYGEKYLQDPQVSVFIREYTTERITVDGAVAKPGIYPLVGQMTLLRALALAGGFGQIANPSEVKVFRRGDNGERQIATFDVDKIRSGKNEDPPLRGDDLIVVQRNAARAALKDSVFRDVLDYLNPFSVFSR